MCLKNIHQMKPIIKRVCLKGWDIEDMENASQVITYY